MKKLVLTLSLVLPACLYTYAQEALPCGQVKATEALRAKYPWLREMELQLEHEEQNQTNEGIDNRATKIIPVVVHIIHNYGPENVSDAQVYDAIRILNEDFQGRQPDTANIAPAFKGIRGNPNFEFRLARKDPNGNCTNGITRTVSPHTFNANEDAKSIAPIWPRNKYMNVWVVQKLENGAGGYTYTPGTAAFMPGGDGIILVNRQFGGIGTSFGGLLAQRTLSHETGHWFNLQHTWGGNNNPGISCGDDGVADTPETKGVSGQNCNLTQSTCGFLDNIQNIMDYSSCPIMFTAGQATRMLSASNSGTASRSNLWSPSNLTATGVSDGFSDTLCKPQADFNGATRIVCAGGSLSFSDLSYNANVTSRSWTFSNTTDGTTVLTSTAQNPSITFTVPGVYTVAFTASNAQGSSTVTRTAYVRVYPATAQYSNNGYFEDFEGNLDNIGWFIQNDVQSTGWQITTQASVSGTRSMVVRNFAGDGTEMYNLISPSYDLSPIAFPKLRLKYAFARRQSTDDDRLKTYISVNCGTSWVQLSPQISNAAMPTAPVNNATPFVPTATQWVEKEYNIPAAFATATNVRFKFEFDADGGNNFYLDDINLPASSSIEQFAQNGVAWDVFPNPADDYVDVRVSGNAASPVADRLMLCDASGRVIRTQTFTVAETVVRMDVSDLSAGVYFIRTQKGNLAGTKKIIIR